jgi:excisionase family DNA binding protein
MFGDEVLSVEEAARRLGVSPSRVRALLASGGLDGEKLAGTWMVRADSVRHRGRVGRRIGRQLTAENAWAALLFASGEEADWLAPSERYRLLGLLDRDGLMVVSERVHARARHARFMAHPGILERLAANPRLVASGVSAAGALGLGLTAGREVDAYVRESHLLQLISGYALGAEVSLAEANVTLRIIADSAWHLPGRLAPVAAVAVDLAEAPDARTARVGAHTLQQLDLERRWATLRRRPGRPSGLGPDTLAVADRGDQ